MVPLVAVVLQVGHPSLEYQGKGGEVGVVYEGHWQHCEAGLRGEWGDAAVKTLVLVCCLAWLGALCCRQQARVTAQIISACYLTPVLWW